MTDLTRKCVLSTSWTTVIIYYLNYTIPSCIHVAHIDMFTMTSINFSLQHATDETDSGKVSSPKTPKKQDSAPGVLNVSDRVL